MNNATLKNRKKKGQSRFSLDIYDSRGNKQNKSGRMRCERIAREKEGERKRKRL